MKFQSQNVILFLRYYLIYCISARPVNAALLDWFWSSDQDVIRNGEPSQNTLLLSIPYEAKSEDEKFLEEALKFTDLMKSSALDLCQHNVVLKIKTSCSSMTEEELAKMSVNLLNCQSAVDGRKIFPCDEQLNLKECTKDMDPNMWNAYHMMNNRARAVCLASRRSQFQALSEMTVNKLLTTAQEQITRMAALQRGQEVLESLTADTIGTVREGNLQIMLDNEKLRDSQRSIQNYVAYNLKELTREKALIAAGHRELAELTQNIKEKLGEANKELMLQSLERSGHHQQVLTDIASVQKQAQDIFTKIDESTSRLLEHHRIAANQYEQTLRDLAKINATVNYLTNLFTTTHVELQARVDWIKALMGENGEELSRLTSTLLHIAYLLMGMILSSFLSLPMISRVALAVMVPLNLMLIYEKKTDLSLDFLHISVLLVFITIGNAIICAIISYVSPPKPPVYYVTGTGSAATLGTAPVGPAQNSRPSFLHRILVYLRRIYFVVQKTISCWVSGVSQSKAEEALNDSFVSSSAREPDEVDVAATVRRPPAASTPYRKEVDPHSYVSRWLDNSKFQDRIGTPGSVASHASNGSSKILCLASCRTGRRCRNAVVAGRDYCRTHLAGSSVMG